MCRIDGLLDIARITPRRLGKYLTVDWRDIIEILPTLGSYPPAANKMIVFFFKRRTRRYPGHRGSRRCRRTHGKTILICTKLHNNPPATENIVLIYSTIVPL